MFSPDTTLGDIKHQIGLIASGQITGVGRIYEQEPDTPPEDGSVIVAMRKFKVESDTNGKLKLRITFGLFYCKRRKRTTQDMPAVEQYLMPFLSAYSAWGNQTLNNDAELVGVSDGGVVQQPIAGEIYRCLVVNVDVLTEYNIPTS